MIEWQELTAYILWNIWKDRNRWVFKAERGSEIDVVNLAWGEWLEYNAENGKKERESKVKERGTEAECWQKPELGTLKLNVCSECEGIGDDVGVGITARDDGGNLVQTWAIAKEQVLSPVATDLEAIRIALLMAQQNGWRRVEIQMDVKAMADCLQAGKPPVLDAFNAS